MTWVQSSETGVTRREKEELKKKISPTTIREERMDVNRSKLIGRVASAVVAAIVYIYNRRTRRASHWGSASKNNSSNCFSIRWSAVTTRTHSPGSAVIVLWFRGIWKTPTIVEAVLLVNALVRHISIRKTDSSWGKHTEYRPGASMV